MKTKAPRSSERVLNYGSGPPNDGHEREWDTCPGCGNARWQLIIVPDCFHCDRCEKAGPRNGKPPEVEPEQLDFGVGERPPLDRSKRDKLDGEIEQAPIDEADGWMVEEMPDE